MASQRIHLLLNLAGGFCFFAIDQFSKYLMKANPSFAVYLIKPWVGLELFKNPGIAFSLPLPNGIIILITPFILIYLVLLLGKKINQSDNRLTTLGLTLILSGAVSNYIDRILFGYTIDYIRILNSVINLADVSIVLGVSILAIKHLPNSVDNKVLTK